MYSRKNSFSEEHLRILLAICPKVGLAVENAMKFQEAEDSAATDYLTTLPNKRAFSDLLSTELARSKRLNQGFVVLVCDLDGFKSVNDRFGHLVGDKVLESVALRLKEDCREYECVARFGGDEFAFILPGFKRQFLAAKISRLAQIASEAAQEVCGQASLSLSVGEAFCPEDGMDPGALIATADKRMYRMKQRYKARPKSPAPAPKPLPPSPADSARDVLAAVQEYSSRHTPPA